VVAHCTGMPSSVGCGGLDCAGHTIGDSGEKDVAPIRGISVWQPIPGVAEKVTSVLDGGEGETA